MLDLTEDLMEVLEPFDVTMTSWLQLRRRLNTNPDVDLSATRESLTRAFGHYCEEQVMAMQGRHGTYVCDAAVTKLVGIHDTLIRAGRLTGDVLVDKILVYAAHLAAMGPYGPAVWDRAARIVLAAQMTTKEKELKRP